MKKNEEIKAYFNKQGFTRFLRLLEKQYTSSKNGARGYVTLSRIRLEERLALDEFFGVYSVPKPNETKRYSIVKFEQCLESSRFSITIAELLEILKGQPVYTRNEHESLLRNNWLTMIDLAMKRATQSLEKYELILSPSLVMWANELKNHKSSGYRILRNIFNISKDEAISGLAYCLVALQYVQAFKGESFIRLPILSAKITGDAHALDWKNALGRLFWIGLMLQSEQGNAESIGIDVYSSEVDNETYSHAITIREGYRKNGIAPDDLSSQVMFYAPTWYGVYEEKVLTLRQVERLSLKDMTKFECSAIFIVENPSVFAEIIDKYTKLTCDIDSRDSRNDFIVICGNGQPTIAVLKLVDVLLNKFESAKLYYSGDIDLAGISIANGFYKRYQVAFTPWYLGQNVYLRYLQDGIPIAEVEKVRLRDIIFDWNRELIMSMIDKGIKLQQELWVEEIVLDFYKLIGREER